MIDQLFARVCDSPKSQESRDELVRALDREADPRANLIRRQTDAENDDISSPRFPENIARAMEAVLSCGTKWFSAETKQTWNDVEGDFGNLFRPTPIFHRWLAEDDAWVLRGGMPESLSIRAEQWLEAAPEICRRAPLRDLTLYGVYSQKHIENRIAHLAECVEANAPPVILENFAEDIERMKDRPQIGALLTMPPLRGLRSLFVRGIHDDELAELVSLQVCDGLEEFSVELVGGSTSGALEHLRASAQLQSVRSLVLNGNGCDLPEIDDQGCKFLAAASNLGELQQLTLACHALTGKGIAAILNAKGFPKLDSLDVSWNTSEDDLILTRISRHRRASGLKALLLPGSLKNADLDEVNWSRFRSLNHLDLQGARLNEYHVLRLATCESLAGLQKLNLANCTLGDAEIREFVQGRALQSLCALDLSANDFTADGLELLLNSEFAAQLRFLSLPKFAAWDESVEDLTRIVTMIARAPLRNLVQLRFDQGHSTAERENPPFTAEHARILAASEHMPWLTYFQAVCNLEARQILRNRWGRLIIYDATDWPVFP